MTWAEASFSSSSSSLIVGRGNRWDPCESKQQQQRQGLSLMTTLPLPRSIPCMLMPPHFLWDTENAIEKALNAFSSTFVTMCHPDRLGRRIFYVMQSRLISALRLIFSTLFHFKRPGCSLFYTRWKRLSLWKMMKGFSSMSTNQQQAAAAATNETTWGMPGENWRHILCLI